MIDFMVRSLRRRTLKLEVGGRYLLQRKGCGPFGTPLYEPFECIVMALSKSKWEARLKVGLLEFRWIDLDAYVMLDRLDEPAPSEEGATHEHPYVCPASTGQPRECICTPEVKRLTRELNEAIAAMEGPA